MYFLPSEAEIEREMAATGFDRLICIRRIQSRAKIKAMRLKWKG